MLDAAVLLHRYAMELMFNTTVRIERWNAGTQAWNLVDATSPAQVQQPQASESTDDPDAASIEESQSVAVYLRWSADVRVGDRVFWQDGWWTVNRVGGDSSMDVHRIAYCSKSQSALRAEPIAFRRRIDGVWEELGTFEVRFTRVSPGPSVQTGEDTAQGSVIRSPMIGGPETVVLQVGDWFGRNGMPGRIVEKDAHEPEHIEFLYEMEAAVP